MKGKEHGSRRTWGTAFAILCIMAADPAAVLAQDTVPAAPWMDRFRGDVRAATATLAGELDAFLSDREYESALNETRLALKIGVDATSDGELRRILEPRLRLSLPNTERMLFVDIFGIDRGRGDDPAPAAGLLPGEIGGSIDAIQLRLGASFRGLDAAPTIGLRFDEATPSAYAGLRIGGSRQVSSALALSGSQRLVLDSAGGLEALTLLRADWQTDRESLLRAQFVLDWRRDEEGARREPSLIYRRFLDDRTAISFENTLSIYTAASGEADSLESALRLRRQIGTEGLFAEARPWIAIDPEDPDDPTHGLELSLDVAF
jgi:hypothetical protein